ncbi:MAG: hypothetical protein MMC33_001126 [Icmadophila ericetorum]|nr:hypothetical protein [Icmadophila ericetorum]
MAAVVRSCTLPSYFFHPNASMTRAALATDHSFFTSALSTKTKRWACQQSKVKNFLPRQSVALLLPRVKERDPSFQQLRLLSSKNEAETDGEKSPLPPRPKLRERLRFLTPHENIYTVPNVLTFSRLIAAPVVGYLVIHDQHAWAVGLFAYAGITDLIDGWIARRWKLQTVVGTVIDPMADKILMTILTVCLAWKGALPVWVAGIILSRDALLGMAAIYYRYISLPPPKSFSRYWDFSLPSAEVHPTGISKINTALQLGLIGWTVGMPLMTGLGWGEWLDTGLVGMQ